MAEPEDLDRKLEEASEAVDRQILEQDQPAQGSSKPDKDGGKEPLADSHDMPADGQVAEDGDGRGVTALQDKEAERRQE